MFVTLLLAKGSSSCVPVLRLRAYIEAKGGQFEQKVKGLVQNDCLHECFKFCRNLSNIAGNNFTVIYVQECC